MSKVLYVDETGNDLFFIVCGLLVDDNNLELCYRQFKHDIRNYRLSSKDKQKVFTEFKSTLLDRHFQKIKHKMLRSIGEINYSVYWCKWDITGNFNQTVKEQIYLKLLTSILKHVNESDVSIVYDWFKNKSLENNINKTINDLFSFSSMKAGDSQEYHGLQYIDNICSSIRLKESGLYSDYYDIISKKTTKIEIFD